MDGVKEIDLETVILLIHCDSSIIINAGCVNICTYNNDIDSNAVLSLPLSSCSNRFLKGYFPFSYLYSSK